MANQIVISHSRVTKRFGEVVAVNDLSFDIAQGEIFELLGPNRADKYVKVYKIGIEQRIGMIE